jgi:ketosteroid isomerase-like protein
MPKKNVEILLAASKAASDGATVEERESFLSILDPEIEWIDQAEGPADLAGEFHGIDEARDYYARWGAAWAEWNWEIQEVRSVEDVVVTRTWVTGRGRGSGLTLDMEIGQIWTFRNAKVVRYDAHGSWAAALEAVGLSE